MFKQIHKTISINNHDKKVQMYQLIWDGGSNKNVVLVRKYQNVFEITLQYIFRLSLQKSIINDGKFHIK